MSGPRPMPMAAIAAQMPIGLRPLGSGEDVGDGRQGRRHDQRSSDAHRGADGDQAVRIVHDEHRDAGGAEDGESGLQCQLATEAVAQRAHGQQQTREHEQIRVDHPLQGRGRGVELRLKGRQRDVQDGVVEPDDDQRERQHPEGLPAVGECPGRDRQGLSVDDVPVHCGALLGWRGGHAEIRSAVGPAAGRAGAPLGPRARVCPSDPSWVMSQGRTVATVQSAATRNRRRRSGRRLRW